MHALTRDQILHAPDARLEPVEVPEWGGTVYVRSMTGAGRDEYEALSRSLVEKGEPPANIRARVVALFVCDERGILLFSAADVEALGAKSYEALDRVFDAGLRLNALRASDVEELEGN